MSIYRIQAICKSELEKESISSIISNNDDFLISYYTSFTNNTVKSDLYLISSLIMFSIPRSNFFYPNAPAICFGSVDHISLAFTYNIIDFIPFPFHINEFNTRIYKSLPLKYFYSLSNYISISGTRIISNDRCIELTSTELSLFRILLSSFPFAIQRDVLYSIFNNDTLPNSRALDMCISKLRKKLRALIGTDKNLIQAERGYGYKLMQY